MPAGRNNTRRRRVILDEAVQSSEVIGFEAETAAIESTKTYSDAARRRSQLKTTDLIPKRPLPLAVIIATVILVAVSLNGLSLTIGSWDALSESARNIFQFSGVGTLPNWFSSLLLLTTGMASLQIYGMRRHRCDDYNGHYQIWLFLAVLFAVASVNCVVDFRSFFASLAQASGFAGGNGLVVFLVAKMIALTALVVRGILEIRASRAALFAVLVVWIAYASAIVAQIPDVQKQLVQHNDLIVGNMVLVGNIALFLTAIFYSRFVYLHANELIEIRQAQEKNVAAGGADSETDVGATDGPADSAQPILKLETGAATKKKPGRKQAKKMQKQQRRAA